MTKYLYTADYIKEKFPELFKEVSPNSLLSKDHKYSQRATDNILWICDKKHEYEATISNRKKGPGCPYCSGRKRIKGVNDLKTLRPDLMKKWHPENTVDPSDFATGSSKKALWLCEVGHKYEMPIRVTVKNGYCIYCLNQVVLTGFNDIATTNPELLPYWSKLNKDLPNKIMVGTHHSKLWECNICFETWETIPNQVVYALSKGINPCAVCMGRLLIVGKNDFLTVNPILAKEWDVSNVKSPDEIPFNYDKGVFWRCKMNHVWRTRICNRQRGDGCSRCSNRVSKKESVFQKVIEKEFGNLNPTFNNWDIIRPKEIDVAFRSINKLVEFNGNYWHSSHNTLKQFGISSTEYHIRKRDLCEKAGYELAFVWEDDWENNQSEVLSALKSWVNNGDLINHPILNRLFSLKDVE